MVQFLQFESLFFNLQMEEKNTEMKDEIFLAIITQHNVPSFEKLTIYPDRQVLDRPMPQDTDNTPLG